MNMSKKYDNMNNVTKMVTKCLRATTVTLFADKTKKALSNMGLCLDVQYQLTLIRKHGYKYLL